MGSVRLWGQLGNIKDICQLGTVEKGNFVFGLKHFWDALQTFYTFWGLLWMFGVSVGTTVNKVMLDKYS